MKEEDLPKEKKKLQKEDTKDNGSFQKMLGQTDNSTNTQENNLGNIINDPIIKNMAESNNNINNNKEKKSPPLITPNYQDQNAILKNRNLGFLNNKKQHYINNNINNINNINNYYQIVDKNKLLNVRKQDIIQQDSMPTTMLQNNYYNRNENRSYKNILKDNQLFITKVNKIKKKLWILIISSLLLLCLNLSICFNELDEAQTFIYISLALSGSFLLVNFALILSVFMDILADILLSNVFRFAVLMNFLLASSIFVIHLFSTMRILPDIDRNEEKNEIMFLIFGIFILILFCIFMTGLMAYESLLILFKCKNEYIYEAFGYTKIRNYSVNYVKFNEENYENSDNINRNSTGQNLVNNENRK